MESVRVALLGAGRTGTAFLKEMLGYNYIEVVGVCDLEDEAPGLQLARQSGLMTTLDPMELLSLGEQIDLLVELSGDPAQKRQIKDYFERIDNSHTIIMHDLVARLCVSLATRHDRLLPTIHPDDTGIGL